MHWLLFAILGAGCGWLSATTRGGNQGGKVIAPMVIGAIAAVALSALVSFVFSALFFLVKVACVVFGVLVVLALFGAGDSD